MTFCIIPKKIIYHYKIKNFSLKFINNKFILLWTPHFGSMRFPLDGELDFDLKDDFYWLKE